MLAAKGLHIQFDNKVVIEQGELVIQNGRLCLIQSPSGTEKSSIFELLSLNKLDLAESFQIDDQNIKACDEKAINELKLHDVAFVNQKAELLEHMSVKEQLAFSCKLNQNSSRKMNEIIKKLRLTKLKNKKVKKLSGGERQRVALASAFLKDARLLILDEPTAMQDDKNKKTIVSLIDEAVQQGKMVVVATHEHDYFHDYDEYTIDNKKLKVVQLKKATPTKEQDIRPGQLKRIQSYLAKRYLYHFKFVNGLSILVSSLCVALVIGMLTLGQGNIEEQKLNVRDIYQTELLVANSYEGSYTNLDNDSNMAIDEEMVDQLKNVDHVLSVEPFLYLKNIHHFSKLNSDGSSGSERNDVLPVEIVDGDTVVDSGTFDDYYQMIFDQYELDVGEQIFLYSVAPVYSHQLYDDRCSQLNEDGVIYISQGLADHLNLTDLNSQSLKFEMGVFIWEEPAITGEKVKTRSPIIVHGYFEYPIRGILTENIVGDYGAYNTDEVDVFLPIEEIIAIQEKYRKDNMPLLEVMMNTPSNIGGPWEESTMECMNPVWDASVYVLTVDSVDAIDEVTREITSIDPNLNVTVTKAYNSSGFNVNEDPLASTKRTTYLYSVLALVILVIGLVMIQFFTLRVRQKDICYLRQNGLNEATCKSIFWKEFGWKLLIGIIVMYLLTYGVNGYLNSLAPYTVRLSSDMILLAGLFYLVAICLSQGVSQYLFFRKMR